MSFAQLIADHLNIELIIKKRLILILFYGVSAFNTSPFFDSNMDEISMSFILNNVYGYSFPEEREIMDAFERSIWERTFEKNWVSQEYLRMDIGCQ